MKSKQLYKLIRSIIVYSLVSCNALSVSPEQYQQYLALERSHRPEVNVTSLGQMIRSILDRVSGKPFTAHQFVGYSGASFADLEKYKSDFKARALELQTETKSKLGSDAVTVFILGASVDGFGIGYQLLQEMKSVGQLKDVVVTGMASNQAITYHLQGLEKGWGDVISPFQDITYFKTTYTNAEGNRSWELKSSPEGESDTPKILKDLSRFSNAGTMSFNVFGGGVQAFNETLEMILEARNRPHQVQIELYVGHRAGKAKKDTGYRAADMLAYLLNKNQFLLNDKIAIRVRHMDGSTSTIQDYQRTAEFLKTSSDITNAAEKIGQLKKLEITPEVQAEISYHEILTSLSKLPLHEIEKFRIRASSNLNESRERLLSEQDPFLEKLTSSHFDVCETCLKDIQKIENSFRGSLRCQDVY